MTREQYKILKNPESLLPADYLSYAIKNTDNGGVNDAVLRDLEIAYYKLRATINAVPIESSSNQEEILIAMDKLQSVIYYLLDKSKRSRRGISYLID